MRVHCPQCRKKAIITSSKEISPNLTKLYCVCSLPTCGHGFVLDLQFSHTLSPSMHQFPHKAREAIKNASSTEIISLLSLLDSNPRAPRSGAAGGRF